MSCSTGIGTGANTSGRLRVSGDCCMTALNRNEVSPSASTLRTTPMMTWFTPNRIASTASTAPIAAPASTAASDPIHGLPAIVPTRAPPNAPTSSWPSIATLMTPDRSHSTPPRAPRASGTAR